MAAIIQSLRDGSSRGRIPAPKAFGAGYLHLVHSEQSPHLPLRLNLRNFHRPILFPAAGYGDRQAQRLKGVFRARRRFSPLL